MDFFEENSGEGNGSNSYLKFLAKEKAWYIGENVYDMEYILLDPDTIQTGLGRYSGGYEFEFSDIPFSKVENKEGWKKAFSVWAFTSDKQVVQWERAAWGELQGFKSMCEKFWMQKAANEGQLPCFRYLGSRGVKFDSGFSSEVPEFDFVAWKPRPVEFAIPAWANDEDVPAPVAESPVEKTVVTDEDIPF